MQDACVSTEDDDFEDMEDEEEEEDDIGGGLEGRLRQLLAWLDRVTDRCYKRIFRKYAPYIVTLEIYKNTLGKKKEIFQKF